MFKKVLPLLIIIILGLALAYLRLSYKLSGSYGFPLDDSWIHAYFARNMAEGRGMVYNISQPMTSTSALYTLLLSIIYKIHIAPVFNAVALGLLLHLCASALVFLIAKEIKISDAIATLCAVTYAAVPRLIWGAVSGMEVPLYVCMVCLGIYLHIKYSRHTGYQAYLGTIAFALAALARPECAVFFIIALTDKIICTPADFSQKGRVSLIKHVLIHVLLFCLVLAPEVIYNIHSYGLPLPPAFYAKTGAHLSIVDRLSPVGAYLSQIFRICKIDNAAFLVAAIPGLFAFFKMRKEDSVSGAMLIPVSFFLVPVLTGIAARRGAGNDQLLFQCGRYSAYLVMLLVLIGGKGLEFIREQIEQSKPVLSRVVTYAFATAAFVILIQNNITMAHRYALQVQNINNMQVKLGIWAKTLPQNSVLAINDAGAIAYFSRLKIIDTVGVVNPEVVFFVKKYKDRQRGLLAYLEEKKPDFLIVFPKWYPDLVKRGDIFTPIKSINLRHNIVCGGDEMVVYKTHWQ